jgi:hypothetical protein
MKIEIEITPAQVMQLWSSAIEGGDPVTVAAKGGWCDGIELKGASFPADNIPRDGVDPAVWWDKPKFFESGVTLTIEIIEVDDETTGHETKHSVTNADISRGLAVMASKFPNIFAQVLDPMQIDAPCADIFLQCMLFGDEKYA